MISTIIKKLFGSSHDREVRRLQPLVARINQLEESWKKKSDDAAKKDGVQPVIGTMLCVARPGRTRWEIWTLVTWALPPVSLGLSA